MINGLDLFSGYGGAQDALRGLVLPIAYCEIEQGAKRILLRRMRKGQIATAPIWDDVRTLQRRHIAAPIDIITGGFPCQDVSSAGMRKGLEGKRSGLFFEVIRLIREFRPTFVYLENVTGLLVSGMDRVSAELASLHYDHRVGVLSAYDMGAAHLRERVWILAANTKGERFREKGQHRSVQRKERIAGGGWKNDVTDPNSIASRNEWKSLERENPEMGGRKTITINDGDSEFTSNSFGIGLEKKWMPFGDESKFAMPSGYGRWISEPTICGGTNGSANRRDRIRALGNGWVPATAREAFKRLMGL